MENKIYPYRGREWFDELQGNFKKTALLDDKLSKNITLNMDEVDEECERIMPILSENLLPSLHNADLEDHIQTRLIAYDILIEYLMHNLKTLKEYMDIIINMRSIILWRLFHHLAKEWKCDSELLKYIPKRKLLRSYGKIVDIDYSSEDERIAGESL